MCLVQYWGLNFMAYENVLIDTTNIYACIMHTNQSEDSRHILVTLDTCRTFERIQKLTKPTRACQFYVSTFQNVWVLLCFASTTCVITFFFKIFNFRYQKRDFILE